MCYHNRDIDVVLKNRHYRFRSILTDIDIIKYRHIRIQEILIYRYTVVYIAK